MNLNENITWDNNEKQTNKTKPREHVREGGGTFSSKTVCQEKGEINTVSVY